MNPKLNRRREKVKQARLEIVAQLYKRGNTYRKIRSEVMKRLDLKAYSLETVKRDIDTLLQEWREEHIEDMNDAIQLELTRIDEIIGELWEQWERSKTNINKKVKKKRGAPSKTKPNGNGDNDSEGKIRTTNIEETEIEVLMYGDVAYISEIRAQLQERRKLMGLYAPEEKDIKLSQIDLQKYTEEEKQLLLKIGEAALINDKE